MDRMEIHMGNLTSFAARRTFVRVNDAGHRMMAHPSWINTRTAASLSVSSERPYSFMVSGMVRITPRQQSPLMRYVSFIIFLV